MQVEGVELAALADELGTPFYCYSSASVTAAFGDWRSAFRFIGFDGDRHQTCFAVKANGALALLHHLRELGSGFDVVSEGELYRVLQVGGDPRRVVFSGPGRPARALQAAVDADVGLINIEVPEEALLLARLGRGRGAPVRVGLRLNPDLEPHTHPSIATGPRSTKFGLSPQEIEGLLARPSEIEGLEIAAVAVHIGSQITVLGPLVAAARRAMEWADRVRAAGHPVDWLDLGGGLGIAYEYDAAVPSPRELASSLEPEISAWDGGLITEPGRVIAGPCGWLVTRVVAVRERPDRLLAVCDAGMNALLRPALYHAAHRVIRVDADAAEARRYDVVGPLCETGDVLARNVFLPEVAVGSLLAVADAGAYGYVMSSEYNSHPRPAQVWVAGDRWAVIAPRPTMKQMLESERLAPWQEKVRA